MKLIRRSLRLLKRRDRYIFFALAAARALSGFLDIAGIMLIGLVGVLAVGKTSKQINFEVFGLQYSIDTSVNSLMKLMIVIFVLYIGKGLLTVTLVRLQTRLLSKVDASMAAQAATYFFNGPFSRLRAQKMSALHWTLSESVIQAFFVTLGSFSAMIADGTTLILVVAVMFAVDPVACLFAISFFLVTAVAFQRIIGAKQAKLGSRMAQVAQENLSAVEDAFVTYRDNHVYGMKSAALDRIQDPRTKMSYGVGTVQFMATLPRIISEAMLMLGVLSFITWQFMSGSLEESIGVVAVFMVAGLRILGAISPLQNALVSLRNASSQSQLALEAIEAFQKDNQSMAKTKTGESVGDRIEMPLGVSVRNVSFTFPDSTRPVLENISLEIAPGSFVAIIGPSGAGKTTLVDLLLGLFKPDQGELKISNLDVETIINSNLSQVAYVPQKPGIINGTVLENIVLSRGVENVDLKLLDEIIEMTHLDSLISSLPDGLNTIINGTHARLSGGQVQRLGLARALYSNPKLIILDEATSALDAETESFITEAVSKLKPKATVIVIAHRLSTVQHADEVYLIEQGNLTDQGSFSELRKRNPLVEKYVKLMSFEELN